MGIINTDILNEKNISLGDKLIGTVENIGDVARLIVRDNSTNRIIQTISIKDIDLSKFQRIT